MAKEQEYPSVDLIADITAIMRDADKAFETRGGSTRHYIRDVFIPMLEEKGFRFTQKSATDEYAKQQAIAFAAYTAENLWAVYSKTGMWYQHMNEDNPITGEQLYNQFIEQQNKQA